MLIVPREDVNPVDVWQVNGLRGTGTFSFEVENLYVPSGYSHQNSALYIIPMALFFASGFACVALGVAPAGLDATIEFAGVKKPQFERNLMKDNPVVQREVGKAEAIWGAPHAFLFDTASVTWERAREVHTLMVEERIRLRLATTHAIRMASEVVDIAYNLSGADAIFESNPIQRRFQDLHAITQQIQGRMAHYDTAGQFFLGLEPEGLF